MEQNIEYTVFYEEAEEGGWLAHIPALNGITTEADTLDEVKIMAEDAIKCYLETLHFKNLPIPRDVFKSPIVGKLSVSLKHESQTTCYTTKKIDKSFA